jgi:hypothetical protein
MEDVIHEDINPFGEYSKIENQIEFSKQLFLIDKIRKEKTTGGCVFKSDVEKIYTNLV